MNISISGMRIKLLLIFLCHKKEWEEKILGFFLNGLCKENCICDIENQGVYLFTSFSFTPNTK